MKIRQYNPSDCESITRLFYNTVHTVNAVDYTEEQLAVWATGREDVAEWNKRFLASYTLVAEANGQVVGFGNLDGSGYLDMLYVAADYQRRGVATALCNRLEKRCESSCVEVHASVTAKIFFEKRGYTVVKEQYVERSGVFLKNYVMNKQIRVL